MRLNHLLAAMVGAFLLLSSPAAAWADWSFDDYTFIDRGTADPDDGYTDENHGQDTDPKAYTDCHTTVYSFSSMAPFSALSSGGGKWEVGRTFTYSGSGPHLLVHLTITAYCAVAATADGGDAAAYCRATAEVKPLYGEFTSAPRSVDKVAQAPNGMAADGDYKTNTDDPASARSVTISATTTLHGYCEAITSGQTQKDANADAHSIGTVMLD